MTNIWSCFSVDYLETHNRSIISCRVAEKVSRVHVIPFMMYVSEDYHCFVLCILKRDIMKIIYELEGF